MTSARTPNWGLVTLAVYELGGTSKPVRTEDVAVHVWRKAPHRFSLAGYPEHPNVRIVHVSLTDAKKPAKGGLLNGDQHKGWWLTEPGLDWVKSFDTQAERNPSTGDQLDLESARELNRIMQSELLRQWRNGVSKKTRYSVPELLLLPVDAPTNLVADQFQRLTNSAAATGNAEVLEFLAWLSE